MARNPIKPFVLFILLLSNALSVTAASNSTLFTPQAMLSAPRRGTALPSPDGTLAIYTVSTYSFTKHSTGHELRVMNLTEGTSWLFTNSSAVSNPLWLGDGTRFVWLISEDDGSTSFVAGDATLPDEE